jgi:predicted DNA-binding protein with PD1-like motif
MRVYKTGSAYIVRIDRGEEIVTALAQFCTDHRVGLATVQGIGAVDSAAIGLFATATKEYHTVTLTGDHEITCLLGTVTTMDGKPYLHIHATLADASQRAFGGHLTRAVVSGTCEIVVQPLEGTIGRAFDAGVGLNLLDT